MRVVSKKSGFSLVEEVVSIAIISIVVVAFLPIIINNLKNIYFSGNRTVNVSAAENIIGNAIKGKESASAVQTSQTVTITLKNSSGSTILSPGSIQGKNITFYKSSSNQTTLSTFVPN